MVARVELVDEELAVEPEILRIRPQEALRIRRAGQNLELLLLERADVARADGGLCFDVAEAESAAFACLSECRADLKHALVAALAGIRRSVYPACGTGATSGTSACPAGMRSSIPCRRSIAGAGTEGEIQPIPTTSWRSPSSMTPGTHLPACTARAAAATATQGRGPTTASWSYAAARRGAMTFPVVPSARQAVRSA